MYKNAARSLHLVGRTGSYATHGSGRGTVWWNPPPVESDIYKDQREQLVDAGLHLLRDAVIAKREASSKKDQNRARNQMQYALAFVKRNKISKHELENWFVVQSDQKG